MSSEPFRGGDHVPIHTRGQGCCTTCGYRKGMLPRCSACGRRSLHRIVVGHGDLACEYGCPRDARLLERWRAEMRATLAALEVSA